MALDWDPVFLALLEGGGVRPAVVLRLETDPVIRLWQGAVRDLALDSDGVEDVAGAIYSSMGLLTDIPTLNNLLNGDAERLSFGLSGAGITAEIAALASAEAADIRSARVNIGILFFDANWQIGSPVLWPWEGEADSLTVDRQGNGDLASRTITLSVGSITTGRRRPFNAIWSDEDQQRKSPGDKFFSEVRRYSSGITKPWPV